MKPRSTDLDCTDEREGVCTWRSSDLSPTAGETAQRSAGVIRRLKHQRLLFSPSPSPASSFNTQDHYPHFLKLFRHAFGNKQSPYRKQCQAWLSSLGNNHICENCWRTRWKCDTEELRCRACVERHATCPRTLQFKKFLIMREMHITEDTYEKLVQLIPRARNRKRGIGSSSSSHPPVRQSQQVRQKSTRKRMKSVQSDVENEEVDELYPSEPSSDDLPLHSKLSSNPSTIPLLKQGLTYVNRSIEAARLTQVRPSQDTFRTSNRGPTSSSTATPNSAPASVPMVMVDLNPAQVIDELSGIRLALTRMEENLSKFLSNHANPQSPALTARGTHTIPPNPSPSAAVLKSLPSQNSELYTTRSQMDIIDPRASGEDSGVENPENMWYAQTSKERQFRPPTGDQVLGGEPSDLILEGRFMTPSHVLPMIVTLDGADALADK